MTRQTVPPPSAERPPAPRDLDELPVLFRDPPLSAEDLKPLPVLDGLPVFYEDEDEVDMGESNPHVDADEILHLCLKAHFAARPEYQVFSNLDVHYHPSNAKPYVSPDNLVVRPFARLGEDISSYRIGGDGPAPLLTAEILSRRSAQQRDLKEKVVIYANIGVSEYILVDISGRFLPQKLLLKRLQPDRSWIDEQDSDGGVTSDLGFRLIIDKDNRLRVIDAASGKPYTRPDEAVQSARAVETQALARQQAEQRVRELEAELARLKQKLRKRRRP